MAKVFLASSSRIVNASSSGEEDSPRTPSKELINTLKVSIYIEVCIKIFIGINSGRWWSSWKSPSSC